MAMTRIFWTQERALLRRRLVCGWRWYVSALLCTALLLRALVPQGYMPADSDSQDVFFAMVVCTPNGPVEFNERSLGLFNGADHGQSQPDHAQANCSFSAMAWQVLLEGLWQALWLLVVLQVVRALRPRYCAPVWAPSTNIRAARAPPFSV